ncbi:hypothetical protein KP77_09990 [Jeotgalibacillus alimentarius]|uniref:Uncharacterized protein n=1 Tax=Jeotgalibacillus alimentarius TaxID=135826 RepID=A0A0C2VRE1_9BACL|nr:hypothetical protein [Jeotgalibacillus alimentarius]KIL51487.1 hypothetical protein KP77_09990 [Jeotgalibacillus alimentarius]
MNVNLNIDWNIISIISTIIAWVVLVVLVIRTYRKQDEEERPKLLKILLVVLIGLFSFSINIPVFGELVSFAVLPLGVWLLIAFTNKNDRWHVYRKYAWIGFFANYLFLAATLTGLLISSVIYPEDEIDTYLHDVTEASFIKVHPSAPEAEFNLAQFEKDISSFESSYADVIGWYDSVTEQEQVLEPDQTSQIEERFPFLITGIESKEGNSIHVFVESDGKGILITTSEQQFYFRSDTASFLEKRVNEE